MAVLGSDKARRGAAPCRLLISPPGGAGLISNATGRQPRVSPRRLFVIPRQGNFKAYYYYYYHHLSPFQEWCDMAELTMHACSPGSSARSSVTSSLTT